MILRFILIFTALFSSSAGWAEQQSCTAVNVPQRALGPVRNQGVSGLCFAYAAADLASWASGMRVSAIDLALYEFKNSKLRRFRDVYKNGGDTVIAVNAAAEQGFCLEADSPSDEPYVDFSSDPHTPIFDAFGVLESAPWSTHKAFLAARKIFPQITSEDFSSAARFHYIKSRILALQNANCRVRVAAPQLRMQSISNQYPEDFVALIDAELDLKKIVGIGFNSNAIYREQDVEDGHAVAIVGRRWNEQNQACEYLIRDTFGDQCDEYKEHLECKHGTIWVSDQLLRNTVYEVMVLR